jgi:hypothetical protein
MERDMASHSHRRLLIAYLVMLLGAGGLTFFGIGYMEQAREVARQERAQSEEASRPWSAWAPKSTDPLESAEEIAAYVSERYLDPAGKTLVSRVDYSRPVAPDGELLNGIAILKEPQSDAPAVMDRLVVIPQQISAMSFILNGNKERGSRLDTAIALGERGREVRMEALELALRTFRARPEIIYILVYLPALRDLDQPSVLFFQRHEVAQHLTRPLSSTLVGERSLRGRIRDDKIAAIVDDATLAHHFTFDFTSLEDGRRIIVLTPIPSPKEDLLRG